MDEVKLGLLRKERDLEYKIGKQSMINRLTAEICETRSMMRRLASIGMMINDTRR